MLEVLFEILGEFLLQVCGEALLELGLHSLAEPFRKTPTPWLAAVGYSLFGAIFGALSLLVFRHHFTPQGSLRLLNLALTPVAVGLSMMVMGAWRRKRGDALLRIDRFACGYLFALGFAMVRFEFAQ